MIYVRACKYFENKRNVWEIVGFPGGKVVKNPPAIQETWAGEDPLENEMATHSSIFLPRKYHGQRSLVDYSLGSHKELDTTERLNNSWETA